MSKPTATRARPLSPHLTIYRFPFAVVMSIVHRITGGALYFGTLLVAFWLAAAAASPALYDCAQWIFGTWIGRLVLLGYTWALVHHMIGGIRHLIWDTGIGMAKHTSTLFAKMTLVLSITLTIAIWVIGYFVRGGL
ncbi:MAG: succinate dehydrogenase, cytochrome b556 subunit [Rhizobiaceae bacterium]